MEKVTIDAAGKKVGRVASEAAKILMGKTSPAYRPHLLPTVEVEIVNAGKIDITAKKMEMEEHMRYSGFHSGLKKEKLTRVAKLKGYREIIRHAVHGMIRRNKLHKQIMKNLTVTE